MNVRIRNATTADIRAMHRLRNRVRENRLSDTTRINEASYLPYIAAGSAWVAEAEDGLIGFAAVDAPAASVWALFVDPIAEGAGIGRALHLEMLEWARQQGIGRLSLSTEEGSRAVRFYRRAGWTQIAVIPDGEVLFERSLMGWELPVPIADVGVGPLSGSLATGDHNLSFKDPSFQDRIGSAAQARGKALEQLRSKPPLDDQVVAERQAARAERERKEAEKSAAKKAAQQAAKDAKLAEAAAKAAVPPPPTEAERKAARDARYAARKARK